MFIFCAPAGAGKSTICRELLQRDSSLMLSVSTTTRPPRPGEKDGVHYFFVTEREFELRVQDGRFLEHARFGGARYGTELKNIESAKSQGADLLFDIDVQGAESLKKSFPDQVAVVFVFPSSLEVLLQRLRARGTDSEERIAERMRIARRELEVLLGKDFSDYLLLNDELERAVIKASTIISAERMRMCHIERETLLGIFPPPKMP
jgi:guanylate kinase